MVSMYAMCTVDTCPVSRSIYGYAPSKAANIVFAAIFGISFIVYLVQSVRSRSWSFMVGMCVGTASECLGSSSSSREIKPDGVLIIILPGYVGRLMLSKDPFSANGFKIQIICLTFAPVSPRRPLGVIRPEPFQLTTTANTRPFSQQESTSF
jgi:hypothetical protein